MISVIATERRVFRENQYEDVYDVALYLKKYHEVPSNFITKGNIYRNTDSSKTVGGDTFYNNDGELSSFGIQKGQPLKELDIRENGYNIISENRLRHRLVYTTNTEYVRVFETTNHYQSFREISNYEIMPVHYIFLYIFIAYSSIFFIYIVTTIIVRTRKN